MNYNIYGYDVFPAYRIEDRFDVEYIMRDPSINEFKLKI